MSNRRHARATFLADQTAGAATEQAEHLQRFADSIGADTARAVTHPVVRRFTKRLVLWRRAGLIVDCEHLDPGAPQPVHWLPAMPDKLLCRICLVAVGGVLHQRAELTCDHCQRVTHPHDLEGVRIAAGSVLVLASICPDCVALDGRSHR